MIFGAADDDLWMFINGRLVLDLGGVHAAESAYVNLDNYAQSIGLTSGNTYTLDIFTAERHTIASDHAFTTNISSLAPNPSFSSESLSSVPEPGTVTLMSGFIAFCFFSFYKLKKQQKATYLTQVA